MLNKNNFHLEKDFVQQLLFLPLEGSHIYRSAFRYSGIGSSLYVGLGGKNSETRTEITK